MDEKEEIKIPDADANQHELLVFLNKFFKYSLVPFDPQTSSIEIFGDAQKKFAKEFEKDKELKKLSIKELGMAAFMIYRAARHYGEFDDKSIFLIRHIIKIIASRENVEKELRECYNLVNKKPSQ